ncbi:DUF2190 family protein [Spectribacter hydrogenoxidans]|uniref:DUF2190 family protein n=1 Tax=Spectribacter hydrogenoxidans TaxID=3075608 RepID=A0ABU3C0M6_9GAMM|nr:DUF2190 family protein [Salinisphaera sp. W335]MDT0635096.1 DUF2190 family protein [Salinisphaera sp. W335]
MTTKFKRYGETITWTNGTGSDVAVNDLVAVGGVLAVALVDIPDGETGELGTEGVFEVAKVTGTAINQGDPIDYDASEGAVSTGITEATGDLSDCAVCWADAASGDTTASIKLGRVAAVVN